MSSYSDFADSASRILEHKGDVLGNAKARSGELWGSTIANMGQVIPQQVQQVMRESAAKKKTQQIQQILQDNGGDLDQSLPLIMGIDPTLGQKLAKDHAEVQKSVAEVAKIKQDAEKAQLDFSDRLWSQVQDEDSYARAALVSHKLGETVPPQYDPKWVENKKNSLLSLKDQLEAKKPINIPRGGTLVTPQGVVLAKGESFPDPTDKLVPIPGPDGKPVYGTPQPGAPVYEKPGSETAGSDYHQFLLKFAKDKGKTIDTLTTADELAARKAFGQADDRPRVDVNVQGGSAPGNLDKEGLEFAAMDYLLTHRLPARNAGQNGAIISRAAAIGKSIGQSPAVSIQRQAAYAGDVKALNKMQTMSASAEAFESKAIAQTDIIKDLSKQVPRTAYPIINAALQSGRTKISGDENATKLANAIETFSEEYAKVMNGTTGSSAAATDSSRAAAKRLINTAMSQGTMSSVLDLMKKEMDLTMQGYGSVISHITDRMGGTPAPVATTPAAPGNAKDPLGIR